MKMVMVRRMTLIFHLTAFRQNNCIYLVLSKSSSLFFQSCLFTYLFFFNELCLFSSQALWFLIDLSLIVFTLLFMIGMNTQIRYGWER